MDDDFFGFLGAVFFAIALGVFVFVFVSFLGATGSGEDAKYEFFPKCNEYAPAHHEEVVFWDRDAAVVGAQASADGWSNVQVDLSDWEARVTGDCYKSAARNPAAA